MKLNFRLARDSTVILELYKLNGINTFNSVDMKQTSVTKVRILCSFSNVIAWRRCSENSSPISSPIN